MVDFVIWLSGGDVEGDGVWLPIGENRDQGCEINMVSGQIQGTVRRDGPGSFLRLAEARRDNGRTYRHAVGTIPPVKTTA